MTKIISVKKKNLNKLGYKDFEDWNRDPNHIYIGRNMSFYVKGAIESKWKNPFSVKKYGRDDCLKMYEKYILENKKLLDDLHELENKTLGCWCKPDLCHGDILIKLLKKN